MCRSDVCRSDVCRSDVCRSDVCRSGRSAHEVRRDVLRDRRVEGRLGALDLLLHSERRALRSVEERVEERARESVLSPTDLRGDAPEPVALMSLPGARAEGGLGQHAVSISASLDRGAQLGEAR